MNTKVYAILYVGWYVDNGGKYIVKIGTTNDIKRRTYEHNRYYHNKAKNSPMAENENFHMIWHKMFAIDNVEKYEADNKEYWQDLGFGDYIKNDRFVFNELPPFVEIIIRKSYIIPLQ